MSAERQPASDAGNEWLGVLPSHWRCVQLKRDLTFLTSGSRGWAEHYADEGAIFLRIGNLRRDHLDLDLSDIQRVAVPEGAEGERTKVKAGDVLFSITAFMGSVAVVPDISEPAFVSQHVALARITGRLFDPRWVGYVTLSAAGKAYLDARCYGGTKIQLSLDDVAELPVPTPPLVEQSALAAFLDRETGKIDALVAEQERLMALLKEKRQAVISQAVTKGLNPNAKMKPSDVEWLGEVPEHWEMKRLKHLGEAIIGLTYSPADIVNEGSGTLVLRSSNVQGGKIVFDDNVYVATAIPKELVTQAGDILICSRNGSRALIGKNATIDEVSMGLTFGAFMTVFRSQHSGFIACVLNSPLFEFQSGAFMTSTINQLTIGVLNNFEIPFPPPDERELIVKFLEREAATFDTLTTEAKRAIALLKERRAALISAAVTGKIDVRDAVPTEVAA